MNIVVCGAGGQAVAEAYHRIADHGDLAGRITDADFAITLLDRAGAGEA
ncbi:hypothetical protein Acor_70740 [Acrocarpospora corrugata]|uniref:Uncharacterized protein n=1 Tax=Acrocarpospora corrugata TaxID=35763 RepID=A0A5M3W860_9ACTN|nr:hypothetical protein [Acrocarpospora corrugata]GES05006.1 hypothetical protein Acor_70740 [Acrocarpospora corrugata]